MSQQLFRMRVPIDILFNFLKKICDIKDCSYVFTNESYKRSILLNNLNEFIDNVKEYYHFSKQYYVNRKMSFNKIVTIIRQICKNNSVNYTSKIIYNNSIYNIVYYISNSIES
jgi:hypothetical protein